MPITTQWNEVKPKTAFVIKPYKTNYKNPLKLKAGECVKIEKKETEPDWRGWVFCVDSRGIYGWISERCLDRSGDTAVVVKDYDGTEKIKVYFEECGWAWCRNQRKMRGWVPTKNLKWVGDEKNRQEENCRRLE